MSQEAAYPTAPQCLPLSTFFSGTVDHAVQISTLQGQLHLIRLPLVYIFVEEGRAAGIKWLVTITSEQVAAGVGISGVGTQILGAEGQ